MSKKTGSIKIVSVGGISGNQNARQSGLYSARPLVQVEVMVDVTLVELGDLMGDLVGAAFYLAEALAQLEEPKVDVDELAKLAILYATVAGELNAVQAELMGRTDVSPAPLGELEAGAYKATRLMSVKSLSLLLSQIASATGRLQVNGEPQLITVGRTDGSRIFHPTLDYLAGAMRKAKRLIKLHAGYLAWQGRGEQGYGDDPAVVLMRGDNARRGDQ